MRLLMLTGYILFLVAIGHVAAGFIAGFNQVPQ